MTFCIITHVPHQKIQENIFGYAPYVKEMNIWLKYVDNVIVVAPICKDQISAIDSVYIHKSIDFNEIRAFNFITLSSILKAFYYFPKNLFQIYKAMKSANHIHLRCPGNIGLLGCCVQIFFPSKTKTAKYAGNWDLKAKQPLSYKFQKWILNSSFLTKNMQVLVYGEWEKNSKNIKPFFTASYFENEKQDIVPLNFNQVIKFLFVGTLSNGKQPLYAVKLIEELLKNNRDVELTIFGDGYERSIIKNYIADKLLDDKIYLMGNQNQEIIKKAYIENHFVILPSLSEGWPKAVAEGMFWGCLPIATKVSCVPNMLDNEKRGILLTMKLNEDVHQIETVLDNENLYKAKVNQAIVWSRQYTLDLFENEIKKLLLA
ncbi:glycosyltransferase [Flavobacterium sp.]|uniref:glycosyltransferase family 4 protein n=1 Tax=Flavobacterium sp. TaxID=239 RepID=UPI0025F7DA38|nr:glycosyltransferase [Flavobacterium sp.]